MNWASAPCRSARCNLPCQRRRVRTTTRRRMATSQQTEVPQTGGRHRREMLMKQIPTTISPASPLTDLVLLTEETLGTLKISTMLATARMLTRLAPTQMKAKPVMVTPMRVTTNERVVLATGKVSRAKSLAPTLMRILHPWMTASEDRTTTTTHLKVRTDPAQVHQLVEQAVQTIEMKKIVLRWGLLQVLRLRMTRTTARLREMAVTRESQILAWRPLKTGTIPTTTRQTMTGPTRTSRRTSPNQFGMTPPTARRLQISKDHPAGEASLITGVLLR